MHFRYGLIEKQTDKLLRNSLLSIDERKVFNMYKNFTRLVKQKRPNNPINFSQSLAIYYQNKGSVEFVSN